VATQPIPFRKAFWLFFRNSSPNVPYSQDFLDATDLSPWAATACILLGMFAAALIVLGATFFVLKLTGSLWPLLAFLPVYFLCQGAITYLAYRFWIRASASGR